ncbi:hypothetical protein F4780DRAFT_287222 [Xylariomycetidae sp. FL0641]|nr:hypothetical protein F4780DRAFT_287222 [Xylariomycetidae sp. FL0641]
MSSQPSSASYQASNPAAFSVTGAVRKGATVEQWDKLTTGGIYILLFIRDDPPKPNDFHWALYLHKGEHGGLKWHISNLKSGYWIAEHTELRDPFKLFLLNGFFHIATIQLDQADRVDGVVRSYDNDLNRPETTCRTWLLRVLKLLQCETVRGLTGERAILRCGDIDALEQETKDFGNRHAPSCAANKQPRPIEASAICEDLDEVQRGK